MRSSQLTGRLTRHFRTLAALALLFSLVVAILLPSSPRSGTAPNESPSTSQRPAPQAPRASIEGWVKASGSGQAISGAQVSISDGATTYTDDAGYFYFTRDALGATDDSSTRKVSLRVQAPPLGAWHFNDAVFREGDTLRFHALLGAEAITHEPSRATNKDNYRVELLRSFSPGVQANMAAAVSAGALTPPASIRIYRTRTATIEVVPFRTYVKHVLPNEWVPSWSPESLKAGAMAVKTYAWYWVRLGGKQVALGADLKDNVEDQVYDPNVSYASTDAAVDATFDYVMTRNNALFQAQYCAGSYRVDPAGDCPWPGPFLTQWGSSFHADQGRSWAWILQFYYGAQITPRPPGPGYTGEAPPNPTSARTGSPPPTVQPAAYVVGQGSNYPEVFQKAYERNGGEAILGKPVGPVRWWMQYVSEVNVLSQRFSGPTGNQNVWIIYNVLERSRNPGVQAYVMTGQIAAAYAVSQPPGPEWAGAPTSDPFVASGGLHSQGFTKGLLEHTTSGVRLVPWPTDFSAWKAEYFAGAVRPPTPMEPAARPSNVLAVASPDFVWTADNGMAEMSGVGRAHWAAQFTGQISGDGSQKEIKLTASGPAVLWLDGEVAINGLGWNGPAVGVWSGALGSGQHTVKIQYYSGGVDASLRLEVAAPAPKQPASQPAPAPSGASLRTKVSWLSGPRERAVVLHLSDVTSHERLLSVTGRTDREGVATFVGLPEGRYNVHIKGEGSLQSARANIELGAGSVVALDMGPQLEGDLDGDNCVTVDDFVRVQAMLGAHKDIPGFDPAADLNGDGWVTVEDVSLLRSGFDTCGDVSVDNEFSAMSLGMPLRQFLAPWANPAALRRDLAMELVASNARPRSGSVVEVQVVARTGQQQIDGAQFVLRYDPKRLQPIDWEGGAAVGVDPGLTLPAVMGNWIDAAGGALGYSAGVLHGATPGGSFTVASMRFRVLSGSGPTSISFNTGAPKQVLLTNGGQNLLGRTTDLTLSVVP
jgi:hypothetical protein